MSGEEAVVLLSKWFGSREFLVGQMTDSQMDEVAESLGIRAPELRMKVGRWLSNNCLECELYTKKTLRLVVVCRADGSKAAIYQVKEI